MFAALSFILAAIFRDPFVPAALEHEPQIFPVEEVLLTSGDLSLTQYDVVIEGAEPILLSSKYFSGRSHDPNGGWSIAPHQTLILHTNFRATDEGKHGKKDWITLAEPHGASLNYYCSERNRDLFQLEKDQASNLLQGKLSAKTNLCNQKIHKKPDAFVVECADGGSRHYLFRGKKFEKDKDRRIYHLEKEIKPNGNRIFYEYDNIGRVKRISTKSGDETKEYAWINFDYAGGKWWEKDAYVIDCKKFSVDTSDGRHFEYTFDEKFDETKPRGGDNPPRYLLKKVSTASQPETELIYETKQGKSFLKSCLSLGGPALYASYQDEKLESLETPAGSASFGYEPQKTTVNDSLGGMTTFVYDANGRPISMTRSHSGGTASYHWIRGEIPDERIRIKTFADENGKTIWARQFIYDSKGNVLQERFSGNLTGLSKKSASIREISGPFHVFGEVISKLNTFDFYLHCKLVELRDGKCFFKPGFPEWDQAFGTIDGIQFISDKKNWQCVGFDPDQKNPILTPPLGFFDGFSVPVLDESSAEVCVTQYKYDDLNRMVQIDEPNGRITLFSYLDDTDLLASRFTASLRTQTTIQNGVASTEAVPFICHRQFFSYDADRLLIRKVEDNGSGRTESDLTSATIRKIEKITPHKNGVLAGKPQKSEDLFWDGKKECLLKRVLFEYFPDGNVKFKHIYDAEEKHRYTLSYEYENGKLISETNAIGQKAEYKYEDEQRNRTYVKDFSDIITTYRYNRSNQVIEENRVGRIKKYLYDDKGRLTSTFDERDHETKHILNPWGYLLEEIQPDGTKIEYTNDANGNPITKKTALVTNLIEYNARGQPTKITYPDGYEKTLTYSLDGQLVSEIDEDGIETQYIYDILGNLFSKKRLLNGQELGAETTPHNPFDGIIYHSDFEKNRTYYEYDGAGRKIAETCGKFSLKYGYDSLGRLKSIENGSHKHVFEYDLLDRVTEERDENLKGKVFTKIQYEYDIQGNRSVIRKFIDDQEVEEITEFDPFNRPISVTDPYGHTTTIIYNDSFINEKGEKVLQKTITDPKGIQTVETFDIRNRLAKWERSGFVENYEYDADGRMVRQYSTNPPVETLWTYDCRGRLETLTEAAGTPSARTTRYTYTPSGKIETVTKPSGIVLTYAYDDFGHLKTLSSNDGTLNYTYNYDKVGRLNSAKDEITLKETTRDYDSKGHLTSETLANGFSFSSDYDKQGRRELFTLPNGTNVKYTFGDLFLDSIKFADQKITFADYDLSGKCREIKFSDQFIQRTAFDLLGRETSISSPFFSQKIEEVDLLSRIKKLSDGRNFTYDDFGHLTSDSAHEYTFDPFGFRTAKDDQSFESNPLHQLPMEYDLDGNPKTHQDYRLSYDPLGRLVKLEKKDSIIQYEYDPLHRRIAKTVNSQRTLFLYDDQNEIGCASSLSEIQELRILKPSSKAEIGASVLCILNGQSYTPLHDLFGNIVRLIDSTKQTAMAATYTPYGEEIFSGLASPWRFASKRIDPETKLIHFGRRFYDPETARFITPDPKGFTSGLNLYLYVSNDPLHQCDLYGLESKNNETSFGENLLTISLATTYSASEVCIDYFPVFFAADMLAYGWNYIIESTRWGWIKKDWRIATLPTENVKARTINKLFSPESRKGELFSKTYSDIHGGIEKGIILGSLGSLGVKKIFSRNAARYFEKYALNKEAEFLGKIKISQIAAETEAVAEEKMLESLALKPDKVAEIEKMIESYLGEGTTMLKNKAGDPIFLSQDGLRRVRFDFIRPKPHTNPHMHIEYLKEEEWIGVGPKQIYPIDVPHN